MPGGGVAEESGARGMTGEVRSKPEKVVEARGGGPRRQARGGTGGGPQKRETRHHWRGHRARQRRWHHGWGMPGGGTDGRAGGITGGGSDGGNTGGGHCWWGRRHLRIGINGGGMDMSLCTGSSRSGSALTLSWR